MTTPVDVFPRDEGTKNVYVVTAGRVLHYGEGRHYVAGTEVLLTPERVAHGLKHLVHLRDEVQVKESDMANVGAQTRAASHPRRNLKAKKKK